MITNSELRHRIDKAQGFFNSLGSQVSKQRLRAELEAEMEKFLANGGEIKQAQNQQFQVKHGTSDQYKKRSCRCDACVAWAVSAGLIKTSKTKVTL